MPPENITELNKQYKSLFGNDCNGRLTDMHNNMYNNHTLPNDYYADDADVAEFLSHISLDLKNFHEETLKYFPAPLDRLPSMQESISRFTTATEALSEKVQRMNAQLKNLSALPENIQIQLLQIASLEPAVSAKPNPLSYRLDKLPDPSYLIAIKALYEDYPEARPNVVRSSILYHHIASAAQYLEQIASAVDSASKIWEAHQNAEDLSAELDAKIQQLQPQHAALKKATSTITKDSSPEDLVSALIELPSGHPIASQLEPMQQLVKQYNESSLNSPISTRHIDYADIFDKMFEYFQKISPRNCSINFRPPLLNSLEQNSFIDDTTAKAMNDKIIEMESYIQTCEQFRTWDAQHLSPEEMQRELDKMPDPTMTPEDVKLTVALLDTINEKKSAADAECQALTHPSPEGADSFFADVDNTSIIAPAMLDYSENIKAYVEKAYGANSQFVESAALLASVSESVDNNSMWLTQYHSSGFANGYSDVAANSQKLRELGIVDRNEYIAKNGNKTIRSGNQKMNELRERISEKEKALMTMNTMGDAVLNAARDASLSANRLLLAKVEAAQNFTALTVVSSLNKRAAASKNAASKPQPQAAPKQAATPTPAAPKQAAPKQEPPKQAAPKQEPPKQEPPKQEPPKQEPPKQAATPTPAPTKQAAPKQAATPTPAPTKQAATPAPSAQPNPTGPDSQFVHGSPAVPPPKSFSEVRSLSQKLFSLNNVDKVQEALMNMLDDHQLPPDDFLPIWGPTLIEYCKNASALTDDGSVTIDPNQFKRLDREARMLSEKESILKENLAALRKQPQSIQEKLLQIAALTRSLSGKPDPYNNNDKLNPPRFTNALTEFSSLQPGILSSELRSADAVQNNFNALETGFNSFYETTNDALKFYNAHHNDPNFLTSLDAEIENLQQQDEKMKQAASTLTEDSSITDLASILGPAIPKDHPLRSQFETLQNLSEESQKAEDFQLTISTLNLGNSKLYNKMYNYFKIVNHETSTNDFSNTLLTGLSNNLYIDQDTANALQEKILNAECLVQAAKSFQSLYQQSPILLDMENGFNEMFPTPMSKDDVLSAIKLQTTMNENKSIIALEQEALTHPAPAGASRPYSDGDNTTTYNPIDLDLSVLSNIIEKQYLPDSPERKIADALGKINATQAQISEDITAQNITAFSDGFSRAQATKNTIKELGLNPDVVIAKDPSKREELNYNALKSYIRKLDKTAQKLMNMPASNNTLLKTAQETSLSYNQLCKTRAEFALNASVLKRYALQQEAPKKADENKNSVSSSNHQKTLFVTQPHSPLIRTQFPAVAASQKTTSNVASKTASPPAVPSKAASPSSSPTAQTTQTSATDNTKTVTPKAHISPKKYIPKTSLQSNTDNLTKTLPASSKLFRRF